MAGDDEEFTRLFQSYYPALSRFLECLLGGRSDLAQDLAQETFLRLHTTEWKELSADHLRCWLYRVARNLAINEFRHGQVQVRLFDHVVEVMRPKMRNPEQLYETQEREQWVLKMLKILPEGHRAALLLREQGQLSYREIADVMDVTESKIKRDIFRAREKLRERWTQRTGFARLPDAKEKV
jgi:RNA polymerase sigma-70 factor, ECF subfamily